MKTKYEIEYRKRGEWLSAASATTLRQARKLRLVVHVQQGINGSKSRIVRVVRSVVKPEDKR